MTIEVQMQEALKAQLDRIEAMLQRMNDRLDVVCGHETLMGEYPSVRPPTPVDDARHSD
jgi:hypothetical protein